MNTQAAADAALKRLTETLNRSAGQHMAAIRRAFERERMRLLVQWNMTRELLKARQE